MDSSCDVRSVRWCRMIIKKRKTKKKAFFFLFGLYKQQYKK